MVVLMPSFFCAKSASDAVATWVLPPLIARIGAVAPGIVAQTLPSTAFTGTGTGSWADSTHSVIWMSRDGKSQALPYLRRTRASQYASLLVAALLTLAAASNLIDVYGSAASWALTRSSRAAASRAPRVLVVRRSGWA